MLIIYVYIYIYDMCVRAGDLFVVQFARPPAGLRAAPVAAHHRPPRKPIGSDARRCAPCSARQGLMRKSWG